MDAESLQEDADIERKGYAKEALREAVKAVKEARGALTKAEQEEAAVRRKWRHFL